MTPLSGAADHGDGLHGMTMMVNGGHGEAIFTRKKEIGGGVWIGRNSSRTLRIKRSATRLADRAVPAGW